MFKIWNLHLDTLTEGSEVVSCLTRPTPGGTLCCVLGQDTLLSQCLSPPRCIKGTDEFNAGSNPVKNEHAIQGGV